MLTHQILRMVPYSDPKSRHLQDLSFCRMKKKVSSTIIIIQYLTAVFVHGWTTTTTTTTECRSPFLPRDNYFDHGGRERTRPLQQPHHHLSSVRLTLSSKLLMMMKSASGNHSPENHKNKNVEENERNIPLFSESLTPSDLGATESLFSNGMNKNNNVNNSSSQSRENIISIGGGNLSEAKTNTHALNQNHDNSDFLPNQHQQKKIEAIVRKKIRVARAQAEIDRILTGPDAPFDVDREWSKVVSIAPTSSTTNTTYVENNHGEMDKDGNTRKQKSKSRRINDENITGSAGKSVNNITHMNDSALSNSDDQDENKPKVDELRDQQLQLLQSQQQQIQHELVCEELEQELYNAVKYHDLDTAAIKRRALDQLQIENANSVLQMNAAFYKAFSSKDYEAMSTLWIPDSTATCIHPYYKKPIIGYTAVFKNWKSLFGADVVSNQKKQNPNHVQAFQKNWIEPSNIHITSIGASSMAIITCNENVYVRRFVRGEKRRTIHVNTLQATNVYRKINGIWYLQYHHASTTTAGTKQQRHPVQILKNNKYSSASSMKRRTLLYNKNKFDECDDKDDDNEYEKEDETNMEVGMDGILGIENFGADLGTSIGKKSLLPGTAQQEQQSQQPKRIIMGSLSDLLKSNLGDLLSGDMKGSNMISNNDGSAIIRFSRIEADEDEEDDIDEYEDEDDDEDEDDEYEFDDQDETLEIIHEELENEFKKKAGVKQNNQGQSVSIIKQWVNAEDAKLKQKKLLMTNQMDGDSSNDDSASTEKPIQMRLQQQLEQPTQLPELPTQPKPATHLSKDAMMRQLCIAKLRQLTQQGLLSPSHKRVILTDIISCAASVGEDDAEHKQESSSKKSLVQVAFELLLGSEYKYTHNNNSSASVLGSATTSSGVDMESNSCTGNDDWTSIAEEEFAEQCRVFAEKFVGDQKVQISTTQR